jgi:hypothetical protein
MNMDISGSYDAAQPGKAVGTPPAQPEVTEGQAEKEKDFRQAMGGSNTVPYDNTNTTAADTGPSEGADAPAFSGDSILQSMLQRMQDLRGGTAPSEAAPGIPDGTGSGSI